MIRYVIMIFATFRIIISFDIKYERGMDDE
jgi:hypothetical protein